MDEAPPIKHFPIEPPAPMPEVEWVRGNIVDGKPVPDPNGKVIIGRKRRG